MDLQNLDMHLTVWAMGTVLGCDSPQDLLSSKMQFDKDVSFFL